jgi:hypothetical protein
VTISSSRKRFWFTAETAMKRAAFMDLVKTEATFKRIDHMVEHGKQFREPIAQGGGGI